MPVGIMNNCTWCNAPVGAEHQLNCPNHNRNPALSPLTGDTSRVVAHNAGLGTVTITEEDYKKLMDRAATATRTPTYPYSDPYPMTPDSLTRTGNALLVRAALADTTGQVMDLMIKLQTEYESKGSGDFELRLTIERPGSYEVSSHQRMLYDFPFRSKNAAGLIYRALGEFVDVMGVLDA